MKESTVRGNRWPVRRVIAAVLLVFFVPLVGSTAMHFAGDAQAADWRTARRDSSGLAPDPAVVDEAVVQVYAARAVRWRGIFGVHTWIAAKPRGAADYTRFEVMGFGVAHGRSAVRVREGIPDGYWFGSEPELLRDVRGGAEVDALIARLHDAADRYPHTNEYRIWPGPNSNTFIAYLGREVPELRLELPPTAIGKDYLPEGALFGAAPSGSGGQVSLFGLLGVMLAAEEGIELSLLGLSIGVDAWPPAIKLPGIGRIGMPEHMPDSERWGVVRIAP